MRSVFAAVVALVAGCGRDSVEFTIDLVVANNAPQTSIVSTDGTVTTENDNFVRLRAIYPDYDAARGVGGVELSVVRDGAVLTTATIPVRDCMKLCNSDCEWPNEIDYQEQSVAVSEQGGISVSPIDCWSCSSGTFLVTQCD